MPINHENRGEVSRDNSVKARVAEGTTPARITRMRGRANNSG